MSSLREAAGEAALRLGTHLKPPPPPVPSWLTMFELAHGRRPSEDEQRRMSDLDRHGAVSDAEYIRRALAVVDRGPNPSAVDVRFGPGDIEYIELGDFTLCIDKADYAIGLHVKNTGQYEPHVTSFLHRVLKPGMRVVDVGANIGFYTMMFAKAVGSGGSVDAFEPRSENCRLLLLGAARNGFRNIRLHPLALSAPGMDFLELTPRIGTNGAARTIGDFTDPAITIVPAVALDERMPGPVDLIKADIEGGEFLAFRGGERPITTCRPVVASEFNLHMLRRGSGIDGWDLIRWFTQRGYRAFVLSREDSSLQEFADPSVVEAPWTDLHRIEDIAFIPGERTELLPAR